MMGLLFKNMEKELEKIAKEIIEELDYEDENNKKREKVERSLLEEVFLDNYEQRIIDMIGKEIERIKKWKIV